MRVIDDRGIRSCGTGAPDAAALYRIGRWGFSYSRSGAGFPYRVFVTVFFWRLFPDGMVTSGWRRQEISHKFVPMSMKKLLLLTLTLSSLCSPLASLAQDKWDLKRCVEYALANNISVKQADVQARLAKLTVEQSQWNQIPTLGLGTQFGLKSGNTQNPNTYALSTQTYTLNNYQVQSSVTVFNFGALRHAVEANRLSWQAALANSDKTKNDITLNVANAYLQVLLAKEQTETSQL